MPKGGDRSRAMFDRIQAEVEADMAEFRESQRLYDEQQTANGNPPKILELPSIYASADDEEPYGSHGKPDEEPYSLILEWSARRNFVESRDQWDVAKYLVRHAEFLSRREMNGYFGKPKDSAWASSVLKLMVAQRVFHEIEIEFLVSKPNTVKN